MIGGQYRVQYPTHDWPYTREKWVDTESDALEMVAEIFANQQCPGDYNISGGNAKYVFNVAIDLTITDKRRDPKGRSVYPQDTGPKFVIVQGLTHTPFHASGISFDTMPDGIRYVIQAVSDVQDLRNWCGLRNRQDAAIYAAYLLEHGALKLARVVKIFERSVSGRWVAVNNVFKDNTGYKVRDLAAASAAVGPLENRLVTELSIFLRPLIKVAQQRETRAAPDHNYVVGG